MYARSAMALRYVGSPVTLGVWLQVGCRGSLTSTPTSGFQPEQVQVAPPWHGEPALKVFVPLKFPAFLAQEGNGKEWG